MRLPIGRGVGMNNLEQEKGDKQNTSDERAR